MNTMIKKFSKAGVSKGWRESSIDLETFGLSASSDHCATITAADGDSLPTSSPQMNRDRHFIPAIVESPSPWVKMNSVCLSFICS